MSVSQPKRDGLHGVRVALLEARMGTELAELVQRYGGVVRSAPAVREAPLTAPTSSRVSERLRRHLPAVCMSFSQAPARPRCCRRPSARTSSVHHRIPEARNDRVPRTEAGRSTEAIRRESACICGVALYEQRAAGRDGGHRSRRRGSDDRSLWRAQRGARRCASAARRRAERIVRVRMAAARRHRSVAGSRSRHREARRRRRHLYESGAVEAPASRGV